MTTNAAATAAVSPQEWPSLLEAAAREVFELMLGCQLKQAAEARDERLEFTSMVGLAGQLCGVLSVHCNSQGATLMASKMLNIAPDKVGPQRDDALGEVCNMIAGNFKNKIPGLSEGCLLSPPTVITGNDYSMHSLGGSRSVQVGMAFDTLPLVISLEVNG